MVVVRKNRKPLFKKGHSKVTKQKYKSSFIVPKKTEHFLSLSSSISDVYTLKHTRTHTRTPMHTHSFSCFSCLRAHRHKHTSKHISVCITVFECTFLSRKERNMVFLKAMHHNWTDENPLFIETKSSSATIASVRTFFSSPAFVSTKKS